jgi:hypothetical protein
VLNKADEMAPNIKVWKMEKLNSIEYPVYYDTGEWKGKTF